MANINRFKLEKVLHNFLDPARLEIQIKDRFGKPVTVREWFLTPLFIIDQLVAKVIDGSVKHHYYDPVSATIKR